MKYNDELLIKMSRFFFAVFDGDISKEEFAELENLLLSNEEARGYYLDIVHTCVGLTDAEGILGLEDLLGNDRNAMQREPGNSADLELPEKHISYDVKLWQQLAEEERNADAVDSAVKEPERELIQHVERVKTVHEINKYSLGAAIISIAAMLFFMIFLKLTPVQNSRQIAILSDLMDAEWTYPKLDFEIGDSISNESMELFSGFAEFTFENGVKLIIEGPARFKFVDHKQVFMEQGRLVAKITPIAKGFTVQTNTATIVDYGTEFGVVCDSQKSQAHCFSGEVDLRTGSDIRYYEKSTRLSAGQAAETDSKSIKKVKLQSEDFFTRIPDKYEVFVRQLKPSFYGFSAGPDQVAITLRANPDITFDESIGVVQNSQLARKDGYSWNFSGSKDGIQFSGMDISEKSYTIAFWFKPDKSSVPENMNLFSARHLRPDGMEFYRHIDIDKTGHVFQYYINSMGKAKIIQTPPLEVKSRTPVSQGKWNHIALVYDRVGRNKKLIINGKVVARRSSKNPQTKSICKGISVGGYFPDQPRVLTDTVNYTGQISDVIYSNKATSIHNIKRLYDIALHQNQN